MKVLRARLESLPIPLCDDETMKKIHQLTGEITVSLKKGLDSEAKSGILELNTVIAGLFDLTDEEIEVAKRGRNAHSHSSKSTDIVTYKKATGFETLIGYLYLLNKIERIAEIINFVLGEYNEENN